MQAQCLETKKRRKPLLLYGARQVGKTYLLKEFGSRSFDHVEYFDLEKQATARAAFSGDLSPKVILANLAQVAGHPIDTTNTLIVFNEVQASNRALASLKYFYEDMPEAYVVAAGSLLGVAVNREGYSMPVGKVDTLTLHPMAFDEFLTAIDQGSLVDGIKSCYATDAPYFLHDRALELYRAYVLVGGMPEAVCIYAETGDFKEVADVQIDARSKSLGVYREKYQPTYALRLSTKNFGYENGIKSIPLYAAFCIQ